MKEASPWNTALNTQTKDVSTMRTAGRACSRGLGCSSTRPYRISARRTKAAYQLRLWRSMQAISTNQQVKSKEIHLSKKEVQTVNHSILQKGGVCMPEFDMEVTDERFEYMKNLLVRLYADQIGMEVKSIKVRPADKATKEPA